MKPGSIPTETVAPKLAMLIRDRWPHGGGLDVLAEKVGCDVSALEGVLAQDSPGVAFDLADALFCALGRPMEDVGLGDIYWAFDLEGEASRDYIPKGHLRCQRTGCGKIFQPHHRAPKTGPHQPRYCSSACNDAAYRHRLRGVKRGVYGPGHHIRKMVCAQGHDLTPDNIARRKDGKRVCLTCQRERQRVWVAEKRAKLKAAA